MWRKPLSTTTVFLFLVLITFVFNNTEVQAYSEIQTKGIEIGKVYDASTTVERMMIQLIDDKHYIAMSGEYSEDELQTKNRWELERYFFTGTYKRNSDNNISLSAFINDCIILMFEDREAYDNLNYYGDIHYDDEKRKLKGLNGIGNEKQVSSSGTNSMDSDILEDYTAPVNGLTPDQWPKNAKEFLANFTYVPSHDTTLDKFKKDYDQATLDQIKPHLKPLAAKIEKFSKRHLIGYSRKYHNIAEGFKFLRTIYVIEYWQPSKDN